MGKAAIHLTRVVEKVCEKVDYSGGLHKKGKALISFKVCDDTRILEKEGNINASKLGKFLECKRDLVVEYVGAHRSLRKSYKALILSRQ